MNKHFLLLAVLFLSAGSLIAAESSPQVPAYAKDWLGCWKHTSKEEMIRIEPARFTEYSPEAGLQFLRAKFDNGKLVVHANGGTVVVAIESKDNKLKMTTDKETTEYTRLDAVPEQLTIKPFPLGAKKDVPAKVVKEVQQQMTERLKTDQAVRTDPARRNDMRTVDQENTEYVKKIISEYGWIDATRFGQEPSHTAFLIVQHSGDTPLMVAVLPEIEKDLKAGKLTDGQSYALLYDRTKLYLGEKQRFGTQVGNRNGVILVFALEDPANVEKRRKELGIFPLSAYLDLFKKQFKADKVEYEQD